MSKLRKKRYCRHHTWKSKAKQIANAGNPRIVSISSWNVFGTSSETTSSVTAKANTASLKPSTRDTSRRRWIMPPDCIGESGNSVTAGRPISHEPGRLVEQHVHEHAGHRHVQPDRKRPARNPAVDLVPRGETPRQRDDGQRQDGRGEGDVR